MKKDLIELAIGLIIVGLFSCIFYYQGYSDGLNDRKTMFINR